MDKEYSVYYIVNSWNNKLYIGMTKNFEARKKQHFSQTYRKKDRKKILYRAMSSFEEKYFRMEKIFWDLTKEEAFFIEAYLINELPTYTPYGYNKQKENYKLQNEGKIKIQNTDLFRKLQEKKKILKKDYCDNLWDW
jgi:predicted GIY-YIG superfamily endonuclease